MSLFQQALSTYKAISECALVPCKYSNLLFVIFSKSFLPYKRNNVPSLTKYQLLDQRHGRITNKELSEILNYNGSYLGRIVKKYTGQSLFDYSMGFAMEYAAKQLASSEKSIAEIAAELNFSNRSHFYKLFRERYGMSPMQYKKGGPK